MDLQLEGKRALVTGSSSGIGAAIARLLAAEGALVVVHGRNIERANAVAESISGAGREAATAIGDLATDAGAEAVADTALAAFGGIDILVNNAGGASDEQAKSWFAVELSEWLSTYQKNVIAAGRLIHRLAPPMKERGWGRIIQIATMAATIPTSAQPDYGPSKAAMLNMSLGLSKALAGSGVTVNSISPGMIRTEGLEQFLDQFAAKRGWDDREQAAEYILKGTGQTVHRIGRPDDVAHAVAYLASPVADFLNGINIHVDGGGTSNVY
jgi:3-oxoacyl-[acyl-carrier protein] reductase